jgi:nucleoside-diphosphate-sugar epimerase
MRVLIIGCGYVGHCLGDELVGLGHEVFGLRRSPADWPGGIRPLIADVTDPESLRRVPLLPFDWVVNTVSSSKGGTEDYRRVYLRGTENVIRWLSPSPPGKYVHTSSTGVYAQDDGSAVSEASPAEGATDAGRVLVATEKRLVDAVNTGGFPAVILRVAGIYGPERGHLFRQYLRGEAVIAGCGDRWINMVHRDDVAGCIVAALDKGRAGEIYNAVDDEPVTQIDFFRWLSETLGRDMPPFGAAGPAGGKRGAASKRVANRKIKAELDYRFRHPTFREGYSAEIRRLRDGGLL